jgi:L-lactate utilization protein LutC
MVTRLITETKEIKPEKYTEQDYEQAVQRLKQNYPKIGRRIYKTSSKSWKQVYEEMVDIIQKEKWTPKLKPKT